MRQVSRKRQKQRPVELDIKRQIWELGNGLCELCKSHPISDRGHEIIFRSHSGDPTNPFNIIQLCLRCHDKAHNLLLDEKPHSKEELLKIVKAIRIRQGFIGG